MSIPFRKLGLGGGGIKGVLHIGGLRELSKHQSLIFPDGIYGVSVGSILATYVAFGLPIEKTPYLVEKYLSMDRILPKLNIKDVTTAFSEKGMFSMDKFEATLIELFDEAGLDIRDKKIKDAKMPLYIVSSNITKGVPAVFSNNVSVTKAILCSCCIPGVFRPQELNGQLYVDGDLFTPCLSNLIPDGLVFSLIKSPINRLTPTSIQSIHPLQYMRSLSRLSSAWIHSQQKNHLTVVFQYPNLESDSDLSEFDMSDIFYQSEKKLHTFLLAECGLKEGSECLG